MTARFAADDPALVTALNQARIPALLMIVGYHVCMFQRAAFPGARVFTHGDWGVDLFLALSAFSLCFSMARNPIPVWEFYRKRFKRIYPAYWLALTLLLILQGMVGPSLPGWFDTLRMYTGLHFRHAPLNPSLWYISLIVALYLAFPLLDYLIMRGNVWTAFSAFAGLTVVCAGWTALQGADTRFLPRIASFAAGMLLFRLRGKKAFDSPGILLGALAFLGYWGMWALRSEWVGWIAKTANTDFVMFLLQPFSAIGFLVLFTWIMERIPLLSGLLRKLSWLGIISYEVYLIHQPFLSDLDFAFRLPHPALGFILFLGITGVGAYAIHWAAKRITP